MVAISCRFISKMSDAMGKELPIKHLNRCRSLEVRQTRDWRGNSGDMRKARRILLLEQKLSASFKLLMRKQYKK